MKAIKVIWGYNMLFCVLKVETPNLFHISAVLLQAYSCWNDSEDTVQCLFWQKNGNGGIYFFCRREKGKYQSTTGI